MEKFIVWGLSILVSAFVGYLAGYMKKKGENLATKEDLDDLVKQVSAVTQTTKAIEAKITDQVWNRQRHWEMKRDSLFAALQALGRVDDALIGIAVVLEAEGKAANPDGLRSAKAEAREAWHRAISDFQQKRVMALVVCGKKTNAALFNAGQQSKACARKLLAGQSNSYEEATPSLKPAIARVFAVIRRELAVQNSESISDSFQQ